MITRREEAIVEVTVKLLSQIPPLLWFCGTVSTKKLGKTVRVVANVKADTTPVQRTSHIARVKRVQIPFNF